MNKTLLALTLPLFTVLTGCTGSNNTQEETQEVQIAIVSIVEIEPIRQLREGFIAEMNGSDFAKNNVIKYEEFNAQGEETMIPQIVDQIVTDKPDLVYVLGTPIAQAIQQRDKDIIIVQGAVTDPIEAGLADSWERSGRNYAANSDLPPVEKQISLIKEMLPNVKNLGVLYNPGEENSVAILKRLREHVPSEGINLVERPVSNASEIASVTNSFLNNIDALYIPPDNTVYSNMRVVGRISRENAIPLFTTTSETIEMGAVAAVALDFTLLGQEAGIIAVDILSGKKEPGEIPIKFSENPPIIINESVAQELGISLNDFNALPSVTIQ